MATASGPEAGPCGDSVALRSPAIRPPATMKPTIARMPQRWARRRRRISSWIGSSLTGGAGFAVGALAEARMAHVEVGLAVGIAVGPKAVGLEAVGEVAMRLVGGERLDLQLVLA